MRKIPKRGKDWSVMQGEVHKEKEGLLDKERCVRQGEVCEASRG